MDGGLRGKKKAPVLVSLPELAALHGARPRIKPGEPVWEPDEMPSAVDPFNRPMADIWD